MPFISGRGVGLNSIVNSDSNAESSEDIKNDLYANQAEEFRWQLFDDRYAKLSIDQNNSGVGPIISMPYSDQVIVLLPTLDVRLITMKIPLVNDEKLKVIMPGLLEEHLLSGLENFEIQIIRPFDNAPALERTVAVIDKSWLDWLSVELSGLVSPHIRLIPDCYLLKTIKQNNQPDQTKQPEQAKKVKELRLVKQHKERDLENVILNQPSIAFDISGKQITWIVKLGEQTGASWIDQIEGDPTEDDLNISELSAYLPNHLQDETIAPFDLNAKWLINSAHQFIEDSSHDGINLLPESFKSMGLKKSSISIDHQNDDEKQYGQGSWSTTKKLAIYFLASVFISYILFALILTAINWAWRSQMNAMAIPHIQESSLSKTQLTKNLLTTRSSVSQPSESGIQGAADMNQFLKEIYFKKRINGLSSKDDFPAMAADLQRLMSTYGQHHIKSIKYDGSSIEFIVDPQFLESNQLSTFDFISKAVSMDMAITSQGENRFTLFPYAGLGAKK